MPNTPITLWQQIAAVPPPYTVSRIAYRLNIVPAQVVRALRQRMKTLGFKNNRHLALHLTMRRDALQALQRKPPTPESDAEIQRLQIEINELTVLECLNRDQVKSHAETALPLFAGQLEASV